MIYSNIYEILYIHMYTDVHITYVILHITTTINHSIFTKDQKFKDHKIMNNLQKIFYVYNENGILIVFKGQSFF